MDRKSNFYKAIEEAIIKPQAEEMKSHEAVPHDFSEQYKEKIAQTAEAVKKPEQKITVSKRKIGFKLFLAIAAAAVLACAVTVTASESVRHVIYRLFTGRGDNTQVSITVDMTESTEPVTDIITYTVPEQTEITLSQVTSVTTLTTVNTAEPVTKLTSVSSVSGRGFSTVSSVVTSVRITETKHIPFVYHGMNGNQRPSMQAVQTPSDYTCFVTTVYGQQVTPVTIILTMPVPVDTTAVNSNPVTTVRGHTGPPVSAATTVRPVITDVTIVPVTTRVSYTTNIVTTIPEIPPGDVPCVTTFEITESLVTTTVVAVTSIQPVVTTHVVTSIRPISSVSGIQQVTTTTDITVPLISDSTDIIFITVTSVTEMTSADNEPTESVIITYIQTETYETTLLTDSDITESVAETTEEITYTTTIKNTD